MNFAKQVVLEIRNEFNTGLISDHVNNIRISDSYGTDVSGESLSSGVMILNANSGDKIDVSGWDYESQQLLTSVDDQFLFWDSVTKTPQAQQTSITIPKTPAHIVVHALRPADWFTAQLATFDNDFPNSAERVALQRYTRGNTISPLFDGRTYWRDLSAEVRRMDPLAVSSGQFWHHAGWSMDDHVILDHDSNTAQPLSPFEIFAKYNKSVVLMLWDNEVPGYPETKAAGVVELDQARRLLDRKTPKKATKQWAAVHMKIATVRKENSLVAYCGGIDLWPDRDTDQRHENSTTKDEFGQHDVQLKVIGPAAYELGHRSCISAGLTSGPTVPSFPFAEDTFCKSRQWKSHRKGRAYGTKWHGADVRAPG
ncbi:MAG: hypothetical protein IPG76_00130 [Acidobacteria bacterium]|nr:hypothetical protein [Acidobacteriota bacterium]